MACVAYIIMEIYNNGVGRFQIHPYIYISKRIMGCRVNSEGFAESKEAPFEKTQISKNNDGKK
jgi:hypothetical protein